MKKTRLMQVLFSAVEKEDEELASQVAGDIETAKENGELDTDEVKYQHVGDGNVLITDKANGEVTLAKKAEDESDTYDLAAVPTEDLDKFLHPAEDGVTPSPVVETQEKPNDILEEEKQFSVWTENTAVQRIFSDQEFCERLFSEVIESDETTKVGNLKIEKESSEPNTVLVTDEATGDQAKVTVTASDLEVTELDQKGFADEDGPEGEIVTTYLVGIDPINHVLVDAPVTDDSELSELAEKLEQFGIQGLQAFDCPNEARDYAVSLLGDEGVCDSDQIEEPEEKEFSEKTSLYVTKYFTDRTNYMTRLFSEAEEGVTESQDKIEEAIEGGEQIETDSEIITPIDNSTAIVEDKETGEFTKATLDESDIDLTKISEDEASELTDDLEVSEKAYTDTYSNFMIRLFSEAEEGVTELQDKIENAIEGGEQIETDEEIITPIDNCIAVVEDKETGEFTKATLDESDIDLEKISEDEASELTDDLEVSEKAYTDTYSNFMIRLFSEAEEGVTELQDKIEEAIDGGEKIETEDDIITPIDEATAIVEDKETGEFTKAVLSDSDIDLEKISEKEASDIIPEEKVVEEVKVDEVTDPKLKVDSKEEEEEQKEYTAQDTLTKFFSDEMIVPEEEKKTSSESVEAIEDKALIAVKSIQDAAEEAVEAIETAKETPAPGEDTDLKESTFSEKTTKISATLGSWLKNK